MTELNHDELTAALEGLTWTFAKTMPTIPHYHCHFSKISDGKARIFSGATGIQRLGKLMRWRTAAPRKYFFAGEWMYWTMSQTPTTVTLINRQIINDDHMAQLREVK